MKSGLWGLVGIALIASAPAIAADMSVKAPVAPVSPVMNWSGFYFGGSLGGAWDKPNQWVFVDVIPNTVTTPPGGGSWIGGLHTGQNWQFGHWVVGTDTNYRFTDLKSTSVCPNPALNCQQQTQNIFTFGGRAGFAWDNWLVYGTGGYANTQIEGVVLNPTTHVITDTSQKWHNGWFAGAGFDYAITSGIAVGLLYTHVNVNNRIDLAPPLVGTDDRQVGGKIDMIEARVSFKLWDGMWGPFGK